MFPRVRRVGENEMDTRIKCKVKSYLYNVGSEFLRLSLLAF